MTNLTHPPHVSLPHMDLDFSLADGRDSTVAPSVTSRYSTNEYGARMSEVPTWPTTHYEENEDLIAIHERDFADRSTPTTTHRHATFLGSPRVPYAFSPSSNGASSSSTSTSPRALHAVSPPRPPSPILTHQATTLSIPSQHQHQSTTLPRSVRQSLIEARKPPIRTHWTKTHDSITFRFVITPKPGSPSSKTLRKTKSFAHIPPANEDGSFPDAGVPDVPSIPSAHAAPAVIDSGSSSSSGSSSPPSSPAPTGPITLASLADGDPATIQRLLACAMFVMRDIPSKNSAPKPLDFGIHGRGSGGKRGSMIAMKHERTVEAEKAALAREGRRNLWKVCFRREGVV